MTVLEIDDEVGEECENECGCDFIEIIFDQGERFELHHVIPDDGAPHAATTECGCHPDIERVDYEFIVVDHKDQDIDLSLDAEEDAWSPSAASTGAAPAPSAPGAS
jgi:hypothetical protein